MDFALIVSPTDLHSARDDGIVVARSRKAHDMDATGVPAALADRLGPEATFGLVELLETSQRECLDVTMAQSTDRFERRLVEEVSKIRVDLGGMDAGLCRQVDALRLETRQDFGALRLEMKEDLGALRLETKQNLAALRLDMNHEFASLREALGAQRFDLLKWSFVFWIGQVVAIGTLFRFLGR
jgi:hypothetical protein